MFEAEKVEIEKISDDAKAKIKKIITRLARKLGKNFPMMEFGVRDKKKRETCIAEGIISDVDITAYATVRGMRGIKLTNDKRFWTERVDVVLTPRGIFECSYVMSEPTVTAEQRREGRGVTISSKPDWKNRYESADLYLKYAEKTLDELAKLLNK